MSRIAVGAPATAAANHVRAARQFTDLRASPFQNELLTLSHHRLVLYDCPIILRHAAPHVKMNICASFFLKGQTHTHTQKTDLVKGGGVVLNSVCLCLCARMQNLIRLVSVLCNVAVC